MTNLTIGTKEVKTVFDLLGSQEDDMTYSFGWCLAKCKPFLDAVCRKLGHKGDTADARIKLQHFDYNDRGFTDVEIRISNQFIVILEAKKDYILPSRELQLSKYVKRKYLKDYQRAYICSLSSFSEEYVSSLSKYHKPLNKVAQRHLSWKTLLQIAHASMKSCGHAEKRLLSQFIEYLKGFVTMQTQTSNMVYVVSLGGKPEKSDISFIDIVMKRKKYFYPFTYTKGGWPAEPPNYLGFRFGGKLQSIRHVEKTHITKYLHSYFSEIPKRDHGVGPYFVFELGPEIKPIHLTLPTGAPWRANRVWCALDTLLTSKTISGARILTQKRLEEAGI